ncbi:MAG: hypothetical protein OXF02_05075 [Simkaniaceae bacterium]|nr:hypothetical protein [Simkaniaceae bacterium]
MVLNPLIQACQVLSSVERASIELKQSTTRNLRELRDVWATSVEKKADLYPEMAGKHRTMAYLSGGIAFVSVLAPCLSYRGYATASRLCETGSTGAQRVADSCSGAYQRFKTDDETLYDHQSNVLRQEVEEQQKAKEEQEAHYRSLQERFLEIMKTISSQTTR